MLINKMVQHNVSNLLSPIITSFSAVTPSKTLVENIVLLGDSITAYASEAIIDRITHDSLMIETFNEAVSGTRISTWAQTGSSGWDSISATYAGKSNLLVYINLGTNDATFPVVGDQTALLAQMDTDMRSLVSQIEADGHTVAIGRLHYREDHPEIVADENVGTKYFNDNFFDAIIAELCPDWYDTSTSTPKLDLYTLTKANVATWLDAGKVHPNAVGNVGIANILYDAFEPEIVRTLTPYSGDPVVVQIGASVATNVGINESNRVNVFSLVDSLAVSQSDIAFSIEGFSGNTTGGLGNPADPTNVTASIQNHALALDSVFDNTLGEANIGLHGCLVGATGTFKAITSRGNYGNTKYTIGATSDTVNGAAAQPEIASIPFTVDANGSVKVTIQGLDGTYTAINGCEFIFD